MSTTHVSSHSVWQLLSVFAFLIFSEPAFSQQGGERPPMPVPTVDAAVKSFPYIKDYPTKLEAYKEVEVHARITAIIKTQHYKEGSKVKAGELLYTLDDRRQKADLEVAKANLASAQTRRNQAELTYNRTKKLLGKNSVSEQQVDDSYAAWQSAISEVKAVEAQVNRAQIEFDDTTIEAEISGIIGERKQDVGDLVDPVSGNTTLNTIRQTDQLYTLFAISDQERQSLFALQDQGLISLSKNPTVTLLNAQGKAIKTGEIDFAASQIDPATASQLLRAKFTNADQRFLPGQLMRVAVTQGEWQNVMPIPQKAIIQNGPQAFVYVIQDGKAQMRPVTLAGAYDDQWLVSKGLQTGDKVIIGNLIKVRPNSPVQPLPPQTTNTANPSKAP